MHFFLSHISFFIAYLLWIMFKVFKDIRCLDQQDLNCRLPECLYGSQFSYTRWKTSTSMLYYVLHSRNFMYIEPGRLVCRPLYRIPLLLCENHCLWGFCEMGMHIFTSVFLTEEWKWIVTLFGKKYIFLFVFFFFLKIQAKSFLFLLYFFLATVIFPLASGTLR